MAIMKSTSSSKASSASLPNRVKKAGERVRKALFPSSPRSASAFSIKTRTTRSVTALTHSVKTRSVQTCSAPPLARAATPAPSVAPSSLDPDQQKFLLCCGVLLKQAQAQGREQELRATIQGRFFGEWPVAIDKAMASAVAGTLRVIERELDLATLATRHINSETSWEVVMAMSVSDIYLHMAPQLASFQERQRLIGIGFSTIRAHHHNIYDRAKGSSGSGNLTLGGDGSIDLTYNVDGNFFKKRGPADSVDLSDI